MQIEFTFSIITMNRSDDLQVTLSSLSEQIDLSTIKLMITDNASSEEHKYKNKALAEKYNAKYYYLDQNLGVSGGRNFSLQKCDTKFVIEIDDDVIFLADNFLESVKNHFRNKECAIVAFNLVSNIDGSNFRREERPFFNKRKKIKNPTKCGWFIGAGHAFDLEKIKNLNYYRTFFPYGSEESDLSLRVYDNGFYIIYDPNIVLYHIKTPSARMPDRSLFALRLAHRLKVSLLNLPFYSIISYSVLRSIQFIYLSRSFLTILDAFKLLYNDRRYILVNRKKIKFKNFVKLGRIGGHIFF